MTDTIAFEILEDGTVSITTDAVSGQNHQSADELLTNLGELLGGEVTVRQRKGHVHRHTHDHQHAKR